MSLTLEALERVYGKCVKQDGHRLWLGTGLMRVTFHGRKRDARALVYEAHTGRRLPTYSRLETTCGKGRCVEASHLVLVSPHG